MKEKEATKLQVENHKKVKSSPTGPEGSRRVKAPTFRDKGTVMVVGCQPYAPAAFTPGAFLMTGNTPGTHFC